MSAEKLITDHIDIWTSAIKAKSASGRGSSKKRELYGIKKLRELILELAVRGKLVPQDPSDEPASLLLERIAAEKAQLVKEKQIKKPKKLAEVSVNEVEFDAPDGWQWIRLNEIGEWGSGSTPKRSVSDFYGGSIPWFKSGELSSDYISNSEEHITELALNETSVRYNNVGDVLVAMYGATIGKTSILKVRATTNQAVCACTPFSGFLNTYLLVLLKAYKGRLVGMGAGGAQPNISREKIINTVFALPPEKEQHRIVAKVDELMALCDQLEQQTEASLDAHQVLVETLLATLTNSQDATELMANWARISEHFDTLFTTEQSIDQLKQIILQLAVMGKLVPQDPNDEPAAKLLERIAEEKAQLVKEKKIKKQKALSPIAEDEKPFELPNGWEWCRFGYILQMISDYHANGGYKTLKENVELLDTVDYAIMLRTTNFSSKNHREYKYITEKAYHFLEKSKLFPGDIIMNKIGDPGATFYVDDRGQPMSLAMNLFLLRTQVVDSELVYLYLLSNYEYIRSFANGTSTKTITKEAVANLVFPLAPLSEQVRILKTVKEMILICEQLRERLNKLKITQIHLTDAIVEQAM
ncbi:restriction endonuclease subunit S [Enterovibrio sp. Hal110]